MNWKLIEDLPESNVEDNPADALLYSPRLGVNSGDIKKYPWGVVAHVPGFHGNAVTDWGVTHWMPLPEPPCGGNE